MEVKRIQIEEPGTGNKERKCWHHLMFYLLFQRNVSLFDHQKQIQQVYGYECATVSLHNIAGLID